MTKWYMVLPLLNLGCAHQPAQAPHPDLPIVLRAFEASDEFTPAEVTWLTEAADRVFAETGGRVALKIVPGASWGQIRPHDPFDPRVVAVDTQFGVKVYGWTDQAHGMHLVPARLPTRHAFVHTAMHELLHAIGVAHVDDNPRALMAPSSNAAVAPLWLSVEDRALVARTIQCEPW